MAKPPLREVEMSLDLRPLHKRFCDAENLAGYQQLVATFNERLKLSQKWAKIRPEKMPHGTEKPTKDMATILAIVVTYSVAAKATADLLKAVADLLHSIAEFRPEEEYTIVYPDGGKVTRRGRDLGEEFNTTLRPLLQDYARDTDFARPSKFSVHIEVHK